MEWKARRLPDQEAMAALGMGRALAWEITLARAGPDAAEDLGMAIWPSFGPAIPESRIRFARFRSNPTTPTTRARRGFKASCFLRLPSRRMERWKQTRSCRGLDTDWTTRRKRY